MNENEKSLLGDVATVDVIHKVELPMQQILYVGLGGLALTLIGFGIKELVKAAISKK